MSSDMFVVSNEVWLSMKKWLLFVAIILGMPVSLCCAGGFSANEPVAVMDFGARPDASPAEIKAHKAGEAASEYLIAALVRKGFIVQDKDLAMLKLNEEGITTAGIIDPDSAGRIGEMLGVRYILYGNVANVSLSDTGGGLDFSPGVLGVDICTVKAHIVARVMDVQTGDIVMMIKGDGSSKSSYVKAGVKMLNQEQIVTIGTKKVTLDSVHNAIQKASADVVDKIATKCK